MDFGAVVLFRWQHNAKENTKNVTTVAVSGTWCQWSKTVDSQLCAETDAFGRGRLFSGTIRLPFGRHRFRYLVDGQWRHDPRLLCERDNDTGEVCNVVEVRPDSAFRLQLPTKTYPDTSAEAVDYMNSLKEYDLRTPPALPLPNDNGDDNIIKKSFPSEEAALLPGTNSSTISADGRGGGGGGGGYNGDCGVDLKRIVASAASAYPVAAISEGEARISSSSSSVAGVVAAAEMDTVAPYVEGMDGGGSDDKGGKQKQSVRHPEARCNGSGGMREPPTEAATAAAVAAATSANVAVNAGVEFDAETVQEFGLDLKALGLPGVRRTKSTSDGGGGNDGHGSALRERVAPAASATYRRREASVAAVGACLVTSSVRKDGKLLVAMVGLPARGKTFVARSIARHLDWVGLKCRIFSHGERRRKEIGVFLPAAYFDQGGEGEKIRMRIAEEVLEEALEALKEAIDIAILDASYVTSERRRWLADAIAASGLHCQVIFIESICNDQELVRQNIISVRESSPEYHNLSNQEAEIDFRARIDSYQKIYQPLEASEGYGFIKLFDVGSQMLTNLISGYIPGRITLLCLNLHLRPRPIWMSRHGESQFNKQGRIGGDAPLTAEGRVYAAKLAAFMEKMHPPSSSRREEELVVWTSTMVRTGETVAPLTVNREVVKWSQLREIDAGLMDSLTYEYVAAEMPQEYEARKKDKLRYRYPEGESYQDLFARLEPVLLEMLRQRSPLLVVGHQAILRVLYGYLTGKAPQECPTIHMPLHTAIKLTPKAYTCEEEWYRPLEEKES